MYVYIYTQSLKDNVTFSLIFLVKVFKRTLDIFVCNHLEEQDRLSGYGPALRECSLESDKKIWKSQILTMPTSS